MNILSELYIKSFMSIIDAYFLKEWFLYFYNDKHLFRQKFVPFFYLSGR